MHVRGLRKRNIPVVHRLIAISLTPIPGVKELILVKSVEARSPYVDMVGSLENKVQAVESTSSFYRRSELRGSSPTDLVQPLNTTLIRKSNRINDC
ncbi:hypothetical protein TNCV_4534381 [Trichonephila clavipes]|nr:hypothetical protein TNCV_4534381 [Trichonephila clavipes]